MRFEKILVIGSGSIAVDCVEILGVNMAFECVEVIETTSSQVSLLKKVCDKLGLNYVALREREAITNAIAEACKNSAVLIVSANNEYLFPSEICSMPNVTIINFHYSYLPDYRGMNIPTWVIFNRESYTGVTWHYVNERVDDGKILLQKKIPLNGSETALDVVRQVMEQGRNTFLELIPELLEKPIPGQSNTMRGGHYYTRRQLPANGFLDINQDTEYIIRLLRAYDYGRARYIPYLKIHKGTETYDIQRYRVTKEGKIILGVPKWTADYRIEKGDCTIELKLAKQKGML